jgi:O-antigen/teichoic acid export membrane protein
MKYLLVVGCGMAVGTTLLSEKIIILFYGASFFSSVRLLQILIWAETLIFLSFVCGSILLAIDRRWVLFCQGILAASLNIVINLPAIHYLGAVGAAITTVMTEILAICFLFWQVNRTGIKVGHRLLRDLGRIIIACAVMSFVLRRLESLHVVTLVVLGAAIYLVTLVLSRFFDTEDIRIGRQALNIGRS